MDPVKSAPAEQLSGKVAEQCTAPDWDFGGQCGNPMPCAQHAHYAGLRPRPAQPQAPALSLDARGDLNNAAPYSEFISRLLAEVKRRRAAPSAPSDALHEALQILAGALAGSPAQRGQLGKKGDES